MTVPILHPNLGSSGILRVVIQLLEEHPQGLTNSQILELAIARDAVQKGPRDHSKAAYFRIKRAVDSLLRLGFVRQAGACELDGRPQRRFVLVPEKIDCALRRILGKAFGSIQARIRNQFPTTDAAHLLVAFEEVLEEHADALGMTPRLPSVSPAVLKIRKGGDSDPEDG